MSLHQILETLIHHTTFRTETERHQMLDLLDAHVDRAEPISETSIARADWRPKLANGTLVTAPPAAMTSDQAAELISLLKAAAPRNVLKGQSDIISEDAPVEPTDVPETVPASPLAPPVSASDVPPGVT